MLTRQTTLSLTAGLAAGAIFSASAFSAAGGLIFLYLPLFPLLLLGLAYGTGCVRIACLAACVMVGVVTDAGNALFFAGFIALPSWYFVRMALLWKEAGEEREWYPVLQLLTHLTLIAAVLFVTVCVILNFQSGGGLQAIMSRELASNLKDADPEFARIMEWLTHDGVFLLFAWAGWLWVLTIYAFAALINGFLLANGLALRPDLTLYSRGLPDFLPGLVLVCGVLAVIGRESDRLAARVVFLLLLLPYFLSGLAWFHSASRSWPGRKIWLFMLYAVLILQPWLALLAIGAGVYGQLAELLDKHGRIG